MIQEKEKILALARELYGNGEITYKQLVDCYKKNYVGKGIYFFKK